MYQPDGYLIGQRNTAWKLAERLWLVSLQSCVDETTERYALLLNVICAIGEPRPVRGLVVNGGFELLVRNCGGVTLAWTCPALIKGMCSPGLCDVRDYGRAGSVCTS